MTADRAAYSDFRNIASAEIEFPPGVSVLIGDNAEGKTNALEGIYLMAAGKSFRTPREREMVRFGAGSFEVKLGFTDSRRSQELGYRVYSGESGKHRECRKNGVPVPRLSEFVGAFRAVLFCPEHLSIVKAGPAERRSFLDVALCQLRPVYLAALSRHNRILVQRNALLRQLSEGGGERGLLEVYSEQLAHEAAFIFVTRREYIKKLGEYMRLFFEELSDVSSKGEIPELCYKNSLKTDEELDAAEAEKRYLAALNANVSREIAAGATLYGSHKDDVGILLDGREARLYASQGQQRSLALAMKLGEGEISREYSGEYPVFLFDDVLSELDPSRQRFLLSRLGGRQVIMTACSPPPFAGGAEFIRVSGGSYKKV